jgi:hypothetical protein
MVECIVYTYIAYIPKGLNLFGQLHIVYAKKASRVVKRINSIRW